MDCIDTWLLSHSTCPLCRASLLPDFPSNHACSPFVFVLESGSESSREIGEAAALGRTSSVFGSISHLGIQREAECGSTRFEFSRKSCEICEKNEVNAAAEIQNNAGGEKIVQVKLGKLKNLDGGEGSSENNVHSRRCYSMGSFAYVLDEASSLQVPIRTPMKKQSSKKPSLPLKPGYRAAISEYGSDSRRDFNGIEAFRSIAIHDSGSCSDISGKPNTIQKTKRESFSISKIWLRGEKKEKTYPSVDSFSYRFPLGRRSMDSGGGDAVARRTISEIEVDGSENGGSEMSFTFDEETQSCFSLDSQVIPPSTSGSTTRRTLLWLMGKQNKVVHSSYSSNLQ
ncbi:hypothetical protein Dimus_025760 [Dionaea muscipula]